MFLTIGLRGNASEFHTDKRDDGTNVTLGKECRFLSVWIPHLKQIEFEGVQAMGKPQHFAE